MKAGRILGPWWQTRQPRERRLLTVGAVLVAGVALVQGAWLPLERARQRAADDHAAARTLLAGVEQAAALARQAGAQAARHGDAPLRATVIETARGAGLTITRLEPQGEALAVWLDAVAAPALHGWVLALGDTHGIRVARASLRRNDDGATVRAQLLFRGGGPA